MLTRLSHVKYNCAALNRCPLRKRLALIGRAKSSACRFRGAEEEDLKHVIFSCPKVAKQRQVVMNACKEFGYAVSLKNLFTRRQLQFPMEKLLIEFLNSNK